MLTAACSRQIEFGGSFRDSGPEGSATHVVFWCDIAVDMHFEYPLASPSGGGTVSYGVGQAGEVGFEKMHWRGPSGLLTLLR